VLRRGLAEQLGGVEEFLQEGDGRDVVQPLAAIWQARLRTRERDRGDRDARRGALPGTVYAALYELRAGGRGDNGDRRAVRREEAADIYRGDYVAGDWRWDDNQVRLRELGGLHSYRR